MTTPVVWRKSSRSGGSSNTDCVEVAQIATSVGVRDSKAPETGYLSMSTATFTALITRVKQAELDL